MTTIPVRYELPPTKHLSTDWWSGIILLITSSTAQGGGGSFKNREAYRRVAVVNQGWQSESTDGPKGA